MKKNALPFLLLALLCAGYLFVRGRFGLATAGAGRDAF